MSRTRTSSTMREATILLVGAMAMLAAGGCENRVGAASCKSASDCAPREACIDGTCGAPIIACTLDNECGEGGLCREGQCIFDLDANAGEGEGEGPVTSGSGVVSLTPQELIDFGSPALGVGVQQVISLSNLGGGTFDVVGISRAEGTSDEFTWASERPFPVTLAPGERVEVTLIYTLADGEDDAGRLLVETTAASCEPVCTDPAAIPVDVISEFKGGRNLLVTPEEHDFGYVPPSQTSAPRSVLITNDGSIDKVLTVTSIDVTGDLAEFDFTLPALPLYLSPGQSHEVAVAYAPQAAATGHELTFTVSANSDAPERLTDGAHLIATSQPPNALVFDPPELVFPQLAVGQTAQRASTLKNIGGTAITVTSLVVGPQIPVEYVVGAAVQLPYTILPNASIDVYVDFHAQTGQTSQNTVQAPNNQASGNVPVLTLSGEGYVPPGGPNVTVSMGPDGTPLPGCMLQATGNVPAANVDLAYRALSSGATCGKPQDPSCGLNGGTCDCAALDTYGDVSWGASRVETVRGETWIVDEKVEHTGGGQDGEFLVRADLLDDCQAVPESTSYSVNYNLCLYDCDFDGPQACFPYSEYPYCSAECQYFASTTTSSDCLQRGPAPIKTAVRIWGGSYDESRYFCTTLQQTGASSDVITLSRQGGYFTFGPVAAGVVEVTKDEPCP